MPTGVAVTNNEMSWEKEVWRKRSIRCKENLYKLRLSSSSSSPSVFICDALYSPGLRVHWLWKFSVHQEDETGPVLTTTALGRKSRRARMSSRPAWTSGDSDSKMKGQSNFKFACPPTYIHICVCMYTCNN